LLFEKKNSSIDKEMTAGKRILFSTSLLENYRPLLDQKNNPIPISQRKSSEPSTSMPTLINNKILRRRQLITKRSEDMHHNPMVSRDFMTPSEFVSTFDNSKESKGINELSDENQELTVEFPKKSFLKKMLNGGGDLRRSITSEAKKRSNRTEMSLNSLMQAYMSNSNRNKL
jgi:hypothetical protein